MEVKHFLPVDLDNNFILHMSVEATTVEEAKFLVDHLLQRLHHRRSFIEAHSKWIRLGRPVVALEDLSDDDCARMGGK